MAIPKNYPDISTPLTAEYLLNYCHPIGQVFYTRDIDFDPNVEWGGTWELDEDGVVYASKSNTNGSPFNVDIGTIIGEDTHTLTVNEMPSHHHGVYLSGGNIPESTGRLDWNRNTAQIYNASTVDTGGDLPHNNIQRTKICNIWIRIA